MSALHFMLDLAQRAAQGDMEATASLLKALAPAMIRAARALLGPSHLDLDDVVQQSLIGLVQALPAFRGDCSPSHYGTRIVARVAVAARHRAELRGDRTDESVELNALPGAAPSPPDHVAAERRRRRRASRRGLPVSRKPTAPGSGTRFCFPGPSLWLDGPRCIGSSSFVFHFKDASARSTRPKSRRSMRESTPKLPRSNFRSWCRCITRFR